MLIPLWLPWTVVAVLLVSALLQPPALDDGPRAGRVRTTALTRAWGMVAVVAVVAAVLTWDRVQVSEEELHEAVEDAVSLSRGGAAFAPQQIEVLTQERLGRAVYVEAQHQTQEQEDSQVTLYEVQVRAGAGEAYDGSSACIEAYEGESWYADVDEGGCDEQ